MLEKRIEELIDLVGLQNGRERSLRSYSKGMLQRIGLAQALIHDPDLLFLDEPTAGVDPLGSSQIRDLILRLKKMGKTVSSFPRICWSRCRKFPTGSPFFSLGKKALEGSLESLLTPGPEHADLHVPAELAGGSGKRCGRRCSRPGGCPGRSSFRALTFRWSSSISAPSSPSPEPPRKIPAHDHLAPPHHRHRPQHADRGGAAAGAQRAPDLRPHPGRQFGLRFRPSPRRASMPPVFFDEQIKFVKDFGCGAMGLIGFATFSCRRRN